MNYIILIAKITVNILPYKIIMYLAVAIGYLAKPLLKKRKQITITNLKIAFHEKSDQEIKN